MSLKNKFDKRFNLLKQSGFNSFGKNLQDFLDFFDNEPILYEIGTKLNRKFPYLNTKVRVFFDSKISFVPKSEEESFGFTFEVLRKISDYASCNKFRGGIKASIYPTEFNVSKYGNDLHKLDELCLSTFKEIYLEKFCLFIEDQLDLLESQDEKQSEVLKLLLRYKQRSEWFHRADLWKLYENETRNGEKLLALNLYSYLFDQGIDFYIEPSSIDGEIDLISTENTNDPLLADAKIFKGDNKHYICKAFNQIYTYTKQFNESTGYLIIYNISDKNLELSLATDSQAVPFIFYDNKTIFFIKIDLYPHSESVSQRKPVKSVKIEKNDLIRSVIEGI